MRRKMYAWYRWFRLYWFFLRLRKPLSHMDQRLRWWERGRWEKFLSKYGPALRRWYYLTFRVSTRWYPNRLELFGMVLKAGAVIRRNFGRGLKASWKEDRTPVTSVDRAISRLFIRKMSRKFKHILVLGEEGWSRIGTNKVMLVLDEWDGTIPGMLGVTAATIIATILVNGVPFATIIHDPILRRTWYAEKDKGAYLWHGGRWPWLKMWLADHGLGFLWKDGSLSQRLHVSDQPLENSINSLMWWTGSVGNLDKVRPLLNAIPGAQWHNFCAVGISGGLIAEGRMVASVFGGRNPRETMAMHLLVEEAGGFARTLFGDNLIYEIDKSLDNFGQFEPIDGHIICNTLDVLKQITMMVLQAEGLMVLTREQLASLVESLFVEEEEKVV